MEISRDVLSSDSSSGFAVGASRADPSDERELADLIRWKDRWRFAASVGGRPGSRWRALNPDDVYSDPRTVLADPECYPAPLIEVTTSVPDVPKDFVRPDL